MKPLSLCELICKILRQYKSWTLLSSNMSTMEQGPKERDGGFEGPQAAFFYVK